MMKPKHTRVAIIVVFTLLYCTHFSFGQGSSLNQVGTSMANFLKIGVGARAASMGDAYVALADDASSLYWNPGGLGMLRKNEIIFQTTDWILDSKLYFLGLTYKINRLGVFGISIYSFSSGDIKETTIYYPDGTGNTFQTSNLAVGVSFSRQITDRFSTGFTVKYIYEQLYLEKASTIGIDVGSLFVTDFLNNLRIGFALSNLGGRMQLNGAGLGFRRTSGIKTYQAEYSTEPWDIPLLFRFGLATDLVKRDFYRMTVAIEALDTRDFTNRLSIGSEIAFQETVFLRGGYKFDFDETDLTVGGGIKINLLRGLEMDVDYAFGNFVIFNNYHRFSIVMAF